MKNLIKLHHEGVYRGIESDILFLHKKDFPTTLPIRNQGLNYVRRYKKHFQLYFCNMMNDGKIIRTYNKDIKCWEQYLKTNNIPYKLTKHQPNKMGYCTTYINIDLKFTKIIK